MKILLSILILLAISVSAYDQEGDILVLDRSNFDQARNEFELLLVDFCVIDIENCNKFLPEYQKVIDHMAKIHPEIKFAKVDTDTESRLKWKYQAYRYPSLKLFMRGSEGDPFTYEGPREGEDLIAWLTEYAGPASKGVKTIEEVQHLFEKHDLVGIFFGDISSDAFTEYLSVAKTHRDFPFVHTTSQDIKYKYAMEGDESFLLLKKFDEGRSPFLGPFSQSAFKEFIKKNKVPIVIPYNDRATRGLASTGLPMLVFLRSALEMEDESENAFREIAPDFKNKFFVTLADYTEEAGRDLVKRLGLREHELPAILVIETSGTMRKFKMNAEMTMETIKEFIQDYLDDKIQPYKISQPIPEDPYENNVRIVVGSNFEEVANDEENDVLVNFFTPECYECDEFASVYSALAGDLADVNNLVIAKVDAASNELEGVGLRKFPSLRLYPRNNKDAPVDYEGNLEKDDIIEFLKTHSQANLYNKGRRTDYEL